VKPLTELRRRLTLRDVPGDEPRGRAESWRPRAALAAVIAGCVGITGIAVAGAGNASPGMKFAQEGRYIYNSALGTIFHINGNTKNADSQIPLPGAGPGTQVVQSDQNAYVLAQGRTYEFGKSNLKVRDPQPAPLAERAVGLEAAGAAFAIYRQNGRIVRFNEHPAVAVVGVPLGQPVVTSAGTVWVHRPDNGQLCHLPLDADRLACPAKVPLGHTGALTVVGTNQVVFVDTTAGDMYTVDDGGIGRQIPLPLADLPGTAIIASNDVAGRVAIVDPQKNLLHLVDTAQLTGDKADTAPVRKQLRKGRYERIASSGNSIALIDESTDTLVTLDRNGDEKGARKIPPPSKKAKVGSGDQAGLYRGGDSRLYVASKSGEQVMVVDDTGEVTPVDTNKSGPDKSKPDPKPGDRPTTTPSKPVPPAEPTIPPDPPRTTDPKPSDRPGPTGDPTNRPGRPSADKPVTPPSKPAVQASRPGAPRSVSGKAGTGSAYVSWEAAAPNGAAVTQYRVTWSGGSRTLGRSARSVDIAGLTNGTGYTFTVRAVNRVGAGPGSSTTQLVPDGGAADAPPNFKVTPGSRKISLSWSRPNLHGGKLQGYQYTASGPGEQQSDSSMSTSHTFTGLTNGDSYLVEVQAITTDAQGNLTRGKTASRIVTVGSGSGSSSPTLQAARGASTSDGTCRPPGCAFIKVIGKGLQPNTAYFFQPYTTQWQPSNPGATLTTDSSGSITITDRFATDAPGQQVWVVATAGTERIQSNKFTWRK
jgi:hypothetical protein